MTFVKNLRGIAPWVFVLFSLVRPAAGIELGALAGATISQFSSADLSWDFGLGYTAGLFADLRLNRWLSVQPQLRFTAIGSGAIIPIRQTGSILDVNISKTVQAVELPVVFRLAPVVREKIKPSLQVGVCLGANIRGRERLRFGDQSSSADIDDEINKKIQAGFLLGIGADFKAGRVPLYLSCLWRGGFPWLAKNFLGQEIMVNALIISLGVGFPI